MKSHACPACGSENTGEAIPYVCRPRPEDVLFAGLSLWSCADCGTHHAVPCPGPSALDRYYEETYRLDGRNSTPPAGFPGENLWYLSRGLSIAHLLRPLLPSPVPAGFRVIDIGAGYGHVLFAVRAALGKGIETAGVEPDPRCHPTLGLVADPILREKPKGAAYNAAFLLHVVEHLPDPLRFLNEAAALVESGGLLVVEVPHCPAVRVRWYNQATPHVPHLHFFTARGLEELLRRANLEIVLLDSFGPEFDSAGSYDASFASTPADPSNAIRLGIEPPIPYEIFLQPGPNRLFLRAIARKRSS
jgi:SAM-dependent methyltransferase